MSYKNSFDIVAFNSRSHALRFSQILKDSGYPNHIISTPKEVSVGCGLSVQFSPSLTPYVIRLYNIYRYPITGFYHIERYGDTVKVIRIPV
ncbi:MAG TPA: DUF3343 domain-containing protein [Clostridiales bacterium]|nr:DUF3343 domain-containing protein [Clostridiales bacterium]